MGRRHTVTAVLVGGWMLLLTYIVASSHFAAVGRDDDSNHHLGGETNGLVRRHRYEERMAVVRGETSVSGLNDGSERSPFKMLRPPAGRRETLNVELARLFSANQSDPRAAFEQVVALSRLLPRIVNVSRMKTPSPETFRNYVAAIGLPVIFTDMLKGQSLSSWTWDYVRSTWGEHVFHNTRQGGYSERMTKAGKHLVNRVSVKLADFIDVVLHRRVPRQGEEQMYITKQRVIPDEELEREFYYPPFYPGHHKKCYLEPTAWIGAPGTFTQGHIDSKDNFAYHILGEKRWTIFSPLDYYNLYYTRGHGSLDWSAVLGTLDEPDLARYPRYARTMPITFTVHPGEVLYLPRGWTHMVENVSPSLMINTWRYGPAAITWYWSEKSREEIKKRCF